MWLLEELPIHKNVKYVGWLDKLYHPLKYRFGCAQLACALCLFLCQKSQISFKMATLLFLLRKERLMSNQYLTFTLWASVWTPCHSPIPCLEPPMTHFKNIQS